MAEGKRKKSKDPSKAAPREERRFLPVRDAKMTASMVVGAIGSVLLGAGVYVQFFRPADNMLPVKLGSQIVELADKGSYIVGAGAVLLAAVILLAPDFETALLVGDGGVGVDDGSDDGPRRILWCDVDKISLVNDALVVKGKDLRVSAPLSSQPQAAAWILREAQERIPSVIALDHGEQESIPRADKEAGEVRKLGELQVAGRHCRASERVISYEPDARICPRCGECYHKESVPEACLTCEGELGDKALRVG